jgi:hypothetical protein
VTGVDELIAWLRHQLDKDERDAPDIHERNCAVDQYKGFYDECDCGWPKRVLAEIEAKRRILDLHSPQATGYVDGVYMHGETGELQCEHCAEQCHSRSGLGCEQPDAPWPCPTVRLVAQPYAGQPGWREEWQA